MIAGQEAPELFDESFDWARALAGQPIVAPPGQETLDEIVAHVLASATG